MVLSPIIALSKSSTEKLNVVVFRAGTDGTGFVCDSRYPLQSNLYYQKNFDNVTRV